MAHSGGADEDEPEAPGSAVHGALAVLREAQALADGSGLVFPSVRGRRLSVATITKMVRDLGIAAVPHGFRSSFRDWAAECTEAPREVCELALAHVNRDRVEAAYRRRTCSSGGGRSWSRGARSWRSRRAGGPIHVLHRLLWFGGTHTSRSASPGGPPSPGTTRVGEIPGRRRTRTRYGALRPRDGSHHPVLAHVPMARERELADPMWRTLGPGEGRAAPPFEPPAFRAAAGAARGRGAPPPEPPRRCAHG